MNVSTERAMVESELPRGYTLQALADRIEAGLTRAMRDGDDEVMFKVPSHSEVSISFDLARTIVGEAKNARRIHFI